MKGLITVVLAANLLIAAHAQSTPPPDPSADGSSPIVIALDPAPKSPVVRILTPVADEKFIHTNSVKVRFQIVSQAASAAPPDFFVQLDGDDPVHTSSMEQTFAGLTPGTHSVTVQLVAANNTPVTGSSAEVQFVVAPHVSSTSRPEVPAATVDPLNVAPEQQSPEPPQLAELKVQQSPPSEIMAMSAPLPSAGSALPLISVIGFGVLVGGIASAMKTR